jgi:NADPH:quinone reductase-like Zn-dependent oxidoreductase
MIGRARYVERDGILSAAVAQNVPEPGPGELLLQIHATSVNYHDLLGVDGGIPGLPVPRVPFSDASATVVAVGKGVREYEVGAAVIPNFFRNWVRGPIAADVKYPVTGDHVDGTLQTHLCVPASSVARAPAGLTHHEAATLGCAALTAWRSVIVEASLQPGQSVVLQGTGGLSLAALAFAKMAGARVIITSSSNEKLARAKALGADVLINYRDVPDWQNAVLDCTNNLGADLVMELGGSATLAQSIAATKVGGHVSIIGALTGRSAPDFPLSVVLSRNITARGITVGSVAHLDAMCRAIEINGYKPVIDSVFSLDTSGEAIELMRTQKHFGKIVIDVAG